MKLTERYEFRRDKIVMRCPECWKEHLRSPKDVFDDHKRFVCVNGCAVLKPKERY